MTFCLIKVEIRVTLLGAMQMVLDRLLIWKMLGFLIGSRILILLGMPLRDLKRSK